MSRPRQASTPNITINVTIPQCANKEELAQKLRGKGRRMPEDMLQLNSLCSEGFFKEGTKNYNIAKAYIDMHTTKNAFPEFSQSYFKATEISRGSGTTLPPARLTARR